MCIFFRIGFDVSCEIEDSIYFFHGKIQWAHYMSHSILLLYGEVNDNANCTFPIVYYLL